VTTAGSTGVVFDTTLDGMRLIVKRDPAHEVVAARLYFRGGSCNLTPETAGAEALFARTARRGTRRFAKERVNALLASIGAELGTVVSHDVTVFTLRCLRRHFDTAWDVLGSIVLEPLLEAAELGLVRDQMLVERRQALDSPDGALGELARLRVYTGHPYAASAHGDDTSLPGLDAEVLRSHVARWFTRTNAMLVFAGDLTGADATRAAAHLAELPRGTGAAAAPPVLRFTAPSVHVEARSLPTNYVLGEFTAPALRDTDFPAMTIAMSVLRDRFFEEVRIKRNLSYAPAASLGNDAANLGSIYVTTVDPRATMEVMRAEIRRLAQEPVPRKDLDDKVRTFVTRYYLQNETNQAQAAFLATHEWWGGGWQRASEFVQRLETVTPDDVSRITREYVRNIQYVVIGDAAVARPDLFVDP
jgi:zinc protease